MSNYAWMQQALDWVAPVASGTGVVYVYPGKVLAFSGQTVAEYDIPFPLADEPFGISFQPARTVNWTRVSKVVVTFHACNVYVSGGTVKLPKLEHFFDPEPISTNGVSYPASDITTAVRSVMGAVSRDAIGWTNCIHFEKDSVVGMPGNMAMLHHVVLGYELEKPAELTYESAKMLVGMALGDDAEIVFSGEMNIEDSNGNVVSESYRTLSVVSGAGRFMTVLGKSTAGSVSGLANGLHTAVKHRMEISAELLDVFKTLKSLSKEYVYADLDFRQDGLFVSGVGVDGVQVPVQYENNECPNAKIRLQIALVDLERKGMTRCGFISERQPFAFFLEDKTVFVMVMEKRN